MKGSIIVRAVILGAANSGKTAFANNLVNKPVPETYHPTLGLDYFTEQDDKFVYRVWEVVEEMQFAALRNIHLHRADILIFVINPADNEFAQQEKIFFEDLAEFNKIATLQGLIVVFSHADQWRHNGEIAAKMQAFKIQLSANCTLKYATLAFSAFTPAARKILAQMQAMVYDPAYDSAYIAALKEKLSDYLLQSSKRLLKPDASRRLTISNLDKTLSQPLTLMEIRNALIAAARDIREPKANGKLKYGINFFRFHYGDYKNSQLYQLICADLEKIEPHVQLDQLSVPFYGTSRKLLKS